MFGQLRWFFFLRSFWSKRDKLPLGKLHLFIYLFLCFLVSLAKRNSFSTLILDCWILSCRMIQQDTWDRRLLFRKSPTQHIPCRNHPSPAICYFHHTWPRSISSLLLFYPLRLSAFSPLSVSSFPFPPRLPPISSSDFILLLYLHIPVCPPPPVILPPLFFPLSQPFVM